jgi:hypothetical protein
MCRARFASWSPTWSKQDLSSFLAAKVRTAFRHPKSPRAVILSGHDGDDAHHYQEKQVRYAIRETNK